ncbi:hypothetical protein FKW77_009871 [Venturia effusa]|uniref:Heterokaryon incompatibility domain-containing protein n=1 Tax=Venturia effusa TaxID=50376 RepID=A0A517LEQ2_9PEZI|nr:hypothetical protein FKW77_009871 [Venturia effusa]
MARRDGQEYIWIDTCCIDKSSSAELTEAINSMYQWCKTSATYFAYLADISAEACRSNRNAICSSHWFTRGWTLQELIAPPDLIFFSSDWTEIGRRKDFDVAKCISSITGIPDWVLLSKDFQPADFYVAQKMAWAADRKTTRIEDMAHCLLGLFDVNMPLLYGEGDRAFIRLQEEIIKHDNDYTIFLWKSPDLGPSGCRGMLARRPSEFEDPNIAVSIQNQGDQPPFAMTNAGLRMDLSLVSMPSLVLFHDSVWPLNDRSIKDECFFGAANTDIYIPILAGTRDSVFLVKLDGDKGSQYARIWPNRIYTFPKEFLHESRNDHPLRRCFVRNRLLIPPNFKSPVRLPFVKSDEIFLGGLYSTLWDLDYHDEVERVEGTGESETVQVTQFNRLCVQPKRLPGRSKTFEIGFGHNYLGHCYGHIVAAKKDATTIRPVKNPDLRVLAPGEVLEFFDAGLSCRMSVQIKLVKDRLVLHSQVSVHRSVVSGGYEYSTTK